MSTNHCRQALAATALLMAASTIAVAQDCTSTPLLGRRVAVGANMSHSTLGETGVGASLGTHIAGPFQLGAAYQATRLNDVDRLEHGGSAALSVPVSLAGFELCPIVTGGYSLLSTSKASTDGRVTTRETRFGASLGRSFALAHVAHVTPFVEPMFVRRSVSWESVDAAWSVIGDATDTHTQVWLGVNVATSRTALVARFRPKNGAEPQEIGVGIVTAFGKR